MAQAGMFQTASATKYAAAIAMASGEVISHLCLVLNRRNTTVHSLTASPRGTVLEEKAGDR